MRFVRVIVAALVLAGCGIGNAGDEPRGVGTATDDLRRSPCACGEPFYSGPPDWI